MAEPPDFDQIARQLDAELDDSSPGFHDRYLLARLKVIAEQLRLVWNARGAADFAKIAEVMDTDNDRPAILGRTLRALDR